MQRCHLVQRQQRERASHAPRRRHRAMRVTRPAGWQARQTCARRAAGTSRKRSERSSHLVQRQLVTHLQQLLQVRSPRREGVQAPTRRWQRKRTHESSARPAGAPSWSGAVQPQQCIHHLVQRGQLQRQLQSQPRRQVTRVSVDLLVEVPRGPAPEPTTHASTAGGAATT